MKKPVFVAVCAAVGLAATAAWAGTKVSALVYVEPTSRYAYGSLGSARNSADTVQYIGCYISAYSNGAEYVGCFARNAANTYVSCSSSVPQIINAVRALGGDGYLYFDYDASGACTSVDVRQVSYFVPRIP